MPQAVEYSTKFCLICDMETTHKNGECLSCKDKLFGAKNLDELIASLRRLDQQGFDGEDGG